jgi:pimeloyl-ACP methyl ester carboxylesterase
MACAWALAWFAVAWASLQAADAGTRADILARMESVMGPFPRHARGPVAMRVVSETNRPGHVLRDIVYESEPGSWVPAYLLVPDAARRAAGRAVPVALALHQTHAAGRKVVVGLGDSPDDEYGVELVRKGWLVLAPAYPQLADYAPDILGLGHASGTMKAIWDNVRGLDLLASMPFTDTNRVVAIGHSLGGHNALFTAAFDERIRAVAASCSFDSFKDYYDGNPEVWREGKGWCQVRYMPRLAAYAGRLKEIPFDFDDVLSAIAPRTLYINAPLRDSNFRWRSVARIVEGVRPRWAGRPGGLVLEQPDVPHRFPPEQRERAFRLLGVEARDR